MKLLSQVPETLIGALTELEEEYTKSMEDPDFKVRLSALLANANGCVPALPTPSTGLSGGLLVIAGKLCGHLEGLRRQGIASLPRRAAFRALQTVSTACSSQRRISPLSNASCLSCATLKTSR